MTTALRRPLAANLIFAGAAIFASLGTFAATTAPAHAATAYYQAQLANPVDGTAKEVQNDVAWRCAGDSCGGNASNSRAEIVCARLARKFGEVTAFNVKGQELDAEALAKCNGAKSEKVARR